MTNSVTTQNVHILPPRDKPYADPMCPGLWYRVGTKRRTFLVRFRLAGKDDRDNLGHFPTMTLKQARVACRAFQERLAAGEVVKTKTAPSISSPKVLTLGGLLDLYEEFRKIQRKNIRKLDHSMHTLRRNLGEHLDRPAASFTDDDLMDVRNTILKRAPQMSNNFLAYFKPVTKWAREEKLIPVNIALGVMKRGPVIMRDRVLSKHEIAAIWNATASGSSEDRLFRFLLLTGQRREEGALLRYGDFLDGVWHQNRNKTNSPVRFLLSADAMALVGAGEARELVFKGRLEGRPLSGFSKFKKALDELSGVSDWQLRDMRRTMSSFMRNELRIPPHVVNACTNHKPPKIDQTYMVGDMPELKHEAFEAWAKYVTALVTSTEMLAVGS